ncbi:MAG: PilZ domain-containing protein [Verrucomicrobiota bacterium]
MLLFKRIFDFSRTALARLRDKRHAKRYPVAPGFPLKATVSLLGTDDSAASAARVDRGLAWSGAVADLSGSGLRLRLPPAAATARGERTVLTLAFEGFALRIPCIVAHYREQPTEALCGLSLRFDDERHRKAYLQLLEAVAIGAGFVADKPARAKAGPVTQRYRSEGRAVLTVSRAGAGAPVGAIELVIGDHCVRSAGEGFGLEVLTAREPRSAVPQSVQRQEILRLFRIVAANLPKTMPADLRERMRALAHPSMPAPGRAALAH